MVSVIKIVYFIMYYFLYIKKNIIKISGIKVVKENRIRVCLIWFNVRVKFCVLLKK